MTANVDLLRSMVMKQYDNLNSIESRVGNMENVVYNNLSNSSSGNAISFCTISNNINEVINAIDNMDEQNGISVSMNPTNINNNYEINITFPDLPNYAVEGYIYLQKSAVVGGSISSNYNVVVIPIVSESIIPKSQMEIYNNSNTLYPIDYIINTPNNKIYSFTGNNFNVSYNNNILKINIVNVTGSRTILIITMRYNKL